MAAERGCSVFLTSLAVPGWEGSLPLYPDTDLDGATGVCVCVEGSGEQRAALCTGKTLRILRVGGLAVEGPEFSLELPL